MIQSAESTVLNGTQINRIIPSTRISNARIVTPDCVIEGDCGIEDGIITEIGQLSRHYDMHIDVKGKMVLPGIIDLHSDALEKFIEPRPSALFPLEMSIFEFDKYILSCGITTMYHCICFMESNNERLNIRSLQNARQLVQYLNLYKNFLNVNARVHARYDLPTSNAPKYLLEKIEAGQIDLLSFMDHTPGQGQYGNIEKFILKRKGEITEEAIQEVLNKKIERQAAINPEDVKAISSACFAKNIPVASHDDDTFEKVEWAINHHVTISEFPVNAEVAQYARSKNMSICMGSPNVIRGLSHSNNISARDAIEAGLCDILCSDYAPMTMLHAVFLLAELEIGSLPEMVKLVSLNPAKASGISNITGSIEIGKIADLIIVDTSVGLPRLSDVFISGNHKLKISN